MEDSDDENLKNEKIIGYYSTLKLNYFSTDEDIKRNFNELYQLYNEKYENDIISGKKNDINLKELLEKIYISYSVLEDRFSRLGYLHMLEIRYYLSQPNSLESCKDKYSSRMFPFCMFEVFKKSKTSNSFSSRILKIDFMNRTLVENQADKIIKGINFSAIMSCQVASKEDEFILVMVEHNTTYSYLYRAKYYPQRDLIVQIALLAKDVYDKRSSVLSVEKNPNLPLCLEESRRIQNKNPRSSQLKLLINDRYIPPKSIFRCNAYEKVNFPGFNKKLSLIVGNSNLLITKDEDARNIDRIIPIEENYLSFSRTKENDSVNLNLIDEKINIKFLKEEDCNNFCNNLNESLHHKINLSETIINLPYLSKDVLVTKIKKDKLMKIIKKIEETTNLLENLKAKKKIIEEEILKEEINNIQKPEEKSKKQENPKEEKKEENIEDEDDEELLRRTSHKIKTIYMKTTNLI